MPVFLPSRVFAGQEIRMSGRLYDGSDMKFDGRLRLQDGFAPDAGIDCQKTAG
jgi:hypothetical protein